ncbi:hypothetical protein [Nitrincola sp.]|uniref:hypothetical protein n=1 Tax=Nitrincola sp. TaxID=1926584 RepID=UPI003A90AE78
MSRINDFIKKTSDSIKKFNDSIEKFNIETEKSNIKTAEKTCAEFGYKLPDGSPIKGQFAVTIFRIISEASANRDYQLLLDLEEQGVIKKKSS